MKKIQKPVEGEYAPYAIMYIELLANDGLVLQCLQDNLQTTKDFIRSFPKEKLTYRWAEGEGTINVRNINNYIFWFLMGILLTACAANRTATSTAVKSTVVPATLSPEPTATAQMPTVSSAQATPVPSTPSSTPTKISVTPTPLPEATVPISPVSPTPVLSSPTPTVAPDLPQSGWQLGPSMPAPARSEMPAITLNGLVYVPGGFGGGNRLEGYDPTTGHWQTLADMPAGRHHLMATTYQAKMYIIGGAQDQSWTPTDTVWSYDPAIDSWETLAPMPEARLAGAAVTLADKIYVAGGAGGGEALLEFIPQTGSWHARPGPEQPREHVTAIVFQNEIWVIGGRWPGVGEVATVEIYDPTAESWRAGPTLNVARAGFAAAVVQEQIMVVGGEVIINGQETLASLEIFRPDSQRWEFGPDLPVPMHGVGGTVLAGQLWLPGGSLRAGAIENEGQVQIYTP